MKVILKWAAMVLCVGWFLLVVMVLIADRSPAQEYEFRAQYGCWVDQWTGRCNSYGYRNVWVRRADRERHRHHGYVERERTYYRDRDYDRGRRYYRAPDRGGNAELREGCRPEWRTRVTGDDKTDKDRAEKSAQDRWSQAVEARRGTIWSDIQHADDLDVMCARKVPSSYTEKGQDLLGVRHWVCDISAVPCTPEREEKDEETRAKKWHERWRDRWKEKRERRSDVREPEATARP